MMRVTIDVFLVCWILCYGVETVRVRKAAVANRQRLWPNGIIPYVINDSFPGELQRLFQIAMRHWENHTCISFIPRRSIDKDYIIFTTDKCGCCSYVGRKGDGEQIISIGKNCDKFGIIVHELGHVVGFSHEHTRPDRDKFVEIFRSNIQEGQDYNFDRAKADEIDSRGETYDYHSIMHYARDTFARNAYLDTILPLKPISGERPKIGQRSKLSEGDVRQTNKMYECPACFNTILSGSGDIVSSNRSIDCNWRIITAIGERVVLNISSKLLPKTRSRYCQHERQNYIEIRDGYTKRSKLISKMCFSTDARIFISTKNVLFVHLSTSKLMPEVLFAKYKTICGGSLTAEYGLLESPRYPEPYPVMSMCQWELTVPENYRVAVVFRYFSMESHKDCSYDRVEVYEGNTVSEHSLINKYCGQDVPKYVTTNASNQMIIKFISDSSIQKTGFHLEFLKELNECEKKLDDCEHECIDKIGGYECLCNSGFSLNKDGKTCDSCGGQLSAKQGSFLFSNYPLDYLSEKKCVWTITADSYHKIVLNISTAFDDQVKDEGCENNPVQIRAVDGNKSSVPLCLDDGVFLSQSSRLSITFQANTTTDKQEFNVSYYLDYDECSKDNGGCQHICRNLIDTHECLCQSGFTLDPDQVSCHQNECFHQSYEPSSIIKTPGFPDYYPVNKNCSWHIITTPGQRVVFTFNSLDIEDHYTCKYDNVAVYDGGNKAAKLLGTFCGQTLPESITSTGNQLLVELTSDDTQPRKGFNASYVSKCGGRLKADSTIGFVYSDARYGDKHYSKMTRCSWEIFADYDMVIKLKFVEFRIEPENDCQYDNVSVYDGLLNNPELLIGRFCGDQLPPIIISTTNGLFIEFETDDNIEDKGFLFEYSAHKKRLQKLSKKNENNLIEHD